MGAVQFFGKQAVVDAYKFRDMQTWAVFDGRDLNASGDGIEDLSAYLDMLAVHGSSGTYKLKVYKSVEDVDDITDKDPCNGSFKFKLSESSSTRMGAMSGPVNTGDIVMNKLHGIVSAEVGKVLEKRFGGKSDDDEEEETWQDVAMGLLKDPNKLAQTIGMIKNLINPGSATASIPVQLAAVGKVERVGQTPVVEMTKEQVEEQAEEIANTLDRLEARDPKILQHLKKLADIAEKKPDTFNFLISNLETM